MKPFDLEAAKNGAAVCLSDGTPVKILDFEFKTKEGDDICYKVKDKLSGFDNIYLEPFETIKNWLFMAPVIAYMNVYKDRNNSSLRGDLIYATKEECEENMLNLETFEYRGIAKVELP